MYWKVLGWKRILEYWYIILKFDQHTNEPVKESNNLVGMITQYISFKTSDIMVPLFKTLIRPVLEYGNPWCQNLKKHVLLIENVQRRFTKRIIGMKNLNYEDRLTSLNLPSLEFRGQEGT